MLCDALFALYLLFFLLFSPVDPETADDAVVIDYVDDDPSSLSAELPGKALPPLIIPISPILALDFATVMVCSYSDA